MKRTRKGSGPVDDNAIIALFNKRDEQAREQLKLKYGAACRQIAYNILKNREDAEEILSDTLLKVWNNVPPDLPDNLGGYVYKTARYEALEAYRRKNRKMRGGDAVTVSVNELSDCVPSNNDVEAVMDQKYLASLLDRFFAELGEDQRRIFLCRYFYNMEYKEIAKKYGTGLSRVKMSVLRTKKKLKEFLSKEGY